jgi:hypothetical protein
MDFILEKSKNSAARKRGRTHDGGRRVMPDRDMKFAIEC